MKSNPIKIRSGFKTLFRLPGGEVKGMTFLTDAAGIKKLVIMVDDKTYISEQPYDAYKELTI